jgi:predicted methyltransferase
MAMGIRLAWLGLAVALIAPPAWSQEAIPAYIAQAVASPLRSPKDVARDPGQKPAEVLAFAGVKPGDRIADFWPTPPYSTALLSGVAGPTGHVYGVLPPKLFKDVPQAEAVVRGMLAPYKNVTPLVQPFDRFAVPEPLDVVWMGKIYHDFPNATEMGPLDIAAVNKAVFRALKPGGIYIVIDHAAPTGSGFRDTEPDDAKRLHRIDPEIVKRQVLDAGFELVGESRLLANPADDHSKSPFDPAMRDRTDRFVFKFRKPGGQATLR